MFGALANSADPSDQGLHCLLKLQEAKGYMKQSSVSVQDHFPSLHSETIDPAVLSVP